MEVDYSQEKNYKCPYCPLSCPDLERFKQHLVNCRKCNDMDAFVCMYYFGHVFTTLNDLESHHGQCIFNQGPALYIDKKRIKLGKTSKEQILNEYYPRKQPLNNQTVTKIALVVNNPIPEIIVPINPIIQPVNNISNGHKARIEPEVVHNYADYQDAFAYYIFEDVQTLRSFNLTYCFGVDFAINTFIINTYKDAGEFGDFFSKEKFDKQKFDSYAALFSLFVPEQESQSFMHFRKTLGNKIGYNDSKSISHNEILIAVTPDSEVIGKFVKTEIAFLVIPSSLLLGTTNTTNSESYYKRLNIERERDMNLDPNKLAEKRKGYKERFMDIVKEYKVTDLNAWMTELQNAQISIPELQDLSQTLEFVFEEFDKKKKEDRLERNKEMETLKNQIQENRKFNNDLKLLLNQKEKKISQLEENLERDKKNAKTKFNKTLQNRLNKCEEKFVECKVDLEKEIVVANSNKDKLSVQVDSFRAEVSRLKKKLVEDNKELEGVLKTNKKLEGESSELILKEQNALKDTGLGLGAPKLSDFTCNACKVRNKQIVFLPCRHMLRCTLCSVNLLEGNSKCEECSCVIENKMEVKKIEYRIPFDEILNNK